MTHTMLRAVQTAQLHRFPRRFHLLHMEILYCGFLINIYSNINMSSIYINEPLTNGKVSNCSFKTGYTPGRADK